MNRSSQWIVLLNESFISMNRSSQWIVYLNESFILMNRSSQWIVHLNESFISINRSSQWIVYLNESFISMNRLSQWIVHLNELFILMNRSSQWIVHFNESFISMNRSFQWIVHLNESFISMYRLSQWIVLLALLNELSFINFSPRIIGLFRNFFCIAVNFGFIIIVGENKLNNFKLYIFHCNTQRLRNCCLNVNVCSLGNDLIKINDQRGPRQESLALHACVVIFVNPHPPPQVHSRRCRVSKPGTIVPYLAQFWCLRSENLVTLSYFEPIFVKYNFLEHIYKTEKNIIH